MDDRELDRLFGNDSDSDKETSGKPKASDKKPEKKIHKKKATEEKVPEKRVSEKKEPQKNDPDKKEHEKKEPVKAEPDKEKIRKKAAEEVQEEPSEEVRKASASSDEGSEEKSEKKPEGKSEEKSEEPEEDKAENESEEKTEEDSKEKTEEESDKDSDDKEDSEEDSGKEDKSSDEEPGKKKAPASGNVQKARREPVPSDKEQTPSLGEMIPLSGKSIFAIVLALIVVLMVVLVMFLPAFRVRNTSIEGNVVLTDQEILKAVGLEYDAHLMSGVSGNIIDILRLDYGKTEEKIKKDNPYIEDIRITIKLPSTVDIKVKERSKVCYIRTPDGYAALDKDGIVLELSSFDAGRSVRPVICGLDVKYAELGKHVKISNMNDYKKSIIVLGAILAADNASVGGDYSMFENTSEVRILPSGYIFLTIYSPSGNLIQIKLNGTDSIGDKMGWLLYVFNGDAFDKITVDGALDMTGDEYIFDEYD